MNLFSKLVMTAIPVGFALSATPALAKAELLADLQCQGQASNGQIVQFHVDGVYNVVRINNDVLKFTDVSKDGKTTEVKAENHFKVYLSKKYKHFEMVYGKSEVLKGLCVDSMTGKSDQADDTEQPDFPQIIGD